MRKGTTMIWILIGLFVFWVGMVIVARNGGGGTLGGKIRASDWWAWNDAMQDKQRELEQLRQAEPKL